MSSSGKPLPSTTPPRLPIMTFGEPWPDLNDGLTYRDLIPPPHAGPYQPSQSFTYMRFDSDRVLLQKVQEFSSRSGRIKNKQIKVDGAVITDPNTILRAGSELVYHRLPWKEPHAPYLLEVLFEDNDLIALNKPSGLQVLPGGLFQQRTVLSQLEWRANKGTSSCKQPHAVPVHRLGRGTSGVLLCAKTKWAKSCLAAYFADGTSAVGNESCNNARFNSTRKISKFYRALVSGIIDQDQVVIDQPIGLVKYTGVAKGLYVASASGKPALSKVSILERNVKNSSTLVQVEIQSGRPHQIRIHLSFIGHPLLGDPLYVAGGQPICFDPEFIDESFAQDGDLRIQFQETADIICMHISCFLLTPLHMSRSRLSHHFPLFCRQRKSAEVDIGNEPINLSKVWSTIYHSRSIIRLLSFQLLLWLVGELDKVNIQSDDDGMLLSVASLMTMFFKKNSQ